MLDACVEEPFPRRFTPDESAALVIEFPTARLL